MVTCDSISSYSLQKLGSNSASTCLGAREGAPGVLPRPRAKFKHGFWQCLEWEALTPGASGRA